jgi:hypothetical protein
MASFSMRKQLGPSVMWRTAVRLLIDALRFVSLGFRSRAQLAAENLFLRKQLALYRECQVTPCRAGDATRITLVVLAQLIDWQAVLTTSGPSRRAPSTCGGRPIRTEIDPHTTDCPSRDLEMTQDLARTRRGPLRTRPDLTAEWSGPERQSARVTSPPP